MTATLDVEPGLPPGPAIGPRERRRLEEARRSRRRYRQAGVVAVALLVLVVAVAGALIGLGLRAGEPPAARGVEPADAEPADAEPADAEPADAGTAVTAPPAAPVAEVPDAAEAPADPAEGAEAPADPGAAADDRVRLQLLNGVGRPGVAEDVEDLLPEGEFRVVVADNAPEFGVRETRLLVYDDDEASLAAAERLRDVLGAGTISVSRQPQSVVDVTVVIGRDIGS